MKAYNLDWLMHLYEVTCTAYKTRPAAEFGDDKKFSELQAKLEDAKLAYSEELRRHENSLTDGTVKRYTEKYDESLAQVHAAKSAMDSLKNILSVWKEERAGLNAWGDFENACESLQKIISEAEGGARTRKLSPTDILNICREVEARVPSKAALRGTVVRYSGSEHFSRSYISKWKPESTHFTAQYVNDHWALTKVYRGRCPNTYKTVKIDFSEAAKEAIIKKMEVIEY